MVFSICLEAVLWIRIRIRTGSGFNWVPEYVSGCIFSNFFFIKNLDPDSLKIPIRNRIPTTLSRRELIQPNPSNHKMSISIQRLSSFEASVKKITLEITVITRWVWVPTRNMILSYFSNRDNQWGSVWTDLQIPERLVPEGADVNSRHLRGLQHLTQAPHQCTIYLKPTLRYHLKRQCHESVDFRVYYDPGGNGQNVW